MMLAIITGLVFMYILVLRNTPKLDLEAQTSTGLRRSLSQRRMRLQEQQHELDDEPTKKRGYSLANLVGASEGEGVTNSLKILVGFFQIITNLAVNTAVPWPQAFITFVSWFSFINISFVPWESVGCLAKIDYYIKLKVMIFTPPCVFAALILGYLVPSLVKEKCDMRDSDQFRVALVETRYRFWKLMLFNLFLIYPSISAHVFGLFDCVTIGNASYLMSDLSLECYDTRWQNNVWTGVIGIIAYPIGIPAVLAYLLWSRRYNLKDPGTRIWLGFMYEAYTTDMWWFELVDMVHKLLITSIVRFFPVAAQLPLCLVIVLGYNGVILLKRPYVRNGDDILHQLAQNELGLLLLTAYIISSGYGNLGTAADIALSTILIAMVVGMFVAYVFRILWVLKGFWNQHVRSKKQKSKRHLFPEEKLSASSRNLGSAPAEMIVEEGAEEGVFWAQNAAYDISRASVTGRNTETEDERKATGKDKDHLEMTTMDAVMMEVGEVSGSLERSNTLERSTSSRTLERSGSARRLDRSASLRAITDEDDLDVVVSSKGKKSVSEDAF